jgi:Transposase zinc-binding domain
MSRPPLEVADLIRVAGTAFLERNRRWLRWKHVKVLLAIARCRTAALGSHLDECTRCGHRAISYNSCRNPTAPSSIKVEVKRKNVSCGWNFSCFAAHMNEQDLFRPATPCARLLDTRAQRLGFLLTSGFHRLLATKLVSSETSKARTALRWRPWFYLGLMAHSFFWFIREGLGCQVRLAARMHTSPNFGA